MKQRTVFKNSDVTMKIKLRRHSYFVHKKVKFIKSTLQKRNNKRSEHKTSRLLSHQSKMINRYVLKKSILFSLFFRKKCFFTKESSTKYVFKVKSENTNRDLKTYINFWKVNSPKIIYKYGYCLQSHIIIQRNYKSCYIFVTW